MTKMTDIDIVNGEFSRFTQAYVMALRILNGIDGVMIIPSRYGDSATIRLFTEHGECVRLSIMPGGNVTVGVLPQHGFGEPFAVALDVARMISEKGNVEIYPLGG